MTVQELIDTLKEMPRDWVVQYSDAEGGGYLPVKGVFTTEDYSLDKENQGWMPTVVIA